MRTIKLKHIAFFIKLAIAIHLISGCARLTFSTHKPHRPQAPVIANVDIALVLGGGGARGVAHVGVLEELLKAGIKPDLIVGCSAGAMIGALYADSLDIDAVKDIAISAKFDDMIDLDFLYLPFSFGAGKALDKYLSRQIKAQRFEDLKMPFIAVATNLQYGDLTAFGTGPLIPAVRASAAYPGAFFPVKIEDQYFVDGGIASPVPVSVARRFKPKIVIAADISEQLTENKPNHMLGLIKRSLEISYIHHSDIAAKQADVVIKFPFRDIGTFNDRQSQALYLEGRKATAAKIDEIRQLIKAKN